MSEYIPDQKNYTEYTGKGIMIEEKQESE